MNFFRSKTISFYKLIIPRESARDIMNVLAEQDYIHFVNFDPSVSMINRLFSNYIKGMMTYLLNYPFLNIKQKNTKRKLPIQKMSIQLSRIQNYQQEKGLRLVTHIQMMLKMILKRNINNQLNKVIIWNIFMKKEIKFSDNLQMVYQLNWKNKRSTKCDNSNDKYDSEDGISEASTQTTMLLIALIFIPIILIPKPLILKHRIKKKEKEIQKNQTEKDLYRELNQVKITIDIFVHQVIETIEFVLGLISNTASYLRH